MLSLSQTYPFIELTFVPLSLQVQRVQSSSQFIFAMLNIFAVFPSLLGKLAHLSHLL